MSETEAVDQAREYSERLVAEAAHWREVAREAIESRPADPKVVAFQKRQRVKQMLADARSGKYKKDSSEKMKEVFSYWLEFCFGQQARLLLGALLLAGCGFWMHQNDLFNSIDAGALKDAASNLVQGKGSIDELKSETQEIANLETEPLSVPVIGKWISSYWAGLAGLILLLSAFGGTWRTSLIVFPSQARLFLACRCCGSSRLNRADFKCLVQLA